MGAAVACHNPANKYMLKSTIKTLDKTCEIYLSHWCRSGVFIANSEHISNFFPVFPTVSFG